LIPVALLGTANSISSESVVGGIASSILTVGALAVLAWMFLELGFARGTIGPNEYGVDPVRR